MLKAFYQDELIEAGCDEAGRGCLAGPVFAASVILPKDFEHPELNDSKIITESKRYELRSFIEDHAIAFSVAMVDNVEIDKINILNASFLAMHRALDQLNSKVEYLIIDGNRFKKYQTLPHACIIKGDGKYYSIAAASILAKTYRDDYMTQLHEQFSGYDWVNNKGYPTKKHRDGIKKLGTTPFHRMSFTLLPDQLELEFSK
ncbi:ribonuclease HII [Solitalea canadensis]|uniref:Ribonuclease HII n=1 Tax=Solitalea canadensis (strain ATCC 29591 / DSM 3403 / JCM 21819 / LMG 8368 / NBRC 15130 / NCIMB 12057 / USAM 9D) TaxID=929556 RepID=H8KWQ5_SOLCM|nr:ribonuclease HII [Solitalea canadensis]AFD08234.1 ribonuclease HII [Solitalea canadensis DSM 3403]